MKSASGGPRRLSVRVPYDAVLKDLFQRDHPILLDRLTRGVAIRATLNVEFASVEQRRADVIFRMADGSLLQLEFQSSNDSSMVYRMGRYCAVIAEQYRCPIRQVVLYMGEPRMRMASSADHGLTKFGYELHDIREFDAEELLRGGRPGDCALALLAGGGREKLQRILRCAMEMPPLERSKLLTQIGVLSGLRRLRGRIKMEVNRMRSAEFIDEHPFLGPIWRKKWSEGRAQGKVEGKAEGMSALLAEMLRAKFGPVPRWAESRVKKATPAQVRRWTRKALTAKTLQEVLGKPARAAVHRA